MLWNSLSSLAQLVLRLAMLAMLARLLAPGDFGVMAVVIMLVGAAAVFSEVFVGPTLIQRKEVTQALLRTGFSLTMIFGVMIAVGLVAGGPQIEAFFKIDGLTQISRGAALIFLLQALATVPEAILMRSLSFKRIAKTDIASYVFGYVAVALPGAILGFGAWALVAGMAAQAAIRWSVLSWISRREFGFGWDRSALGVLLYSGSGFSLNRISSMVATRGDNFIVGKFLGAEALGLYERAYTVMKMPTTLYGTIANKVAFSTLSRVQDDPVKAQRGFARATQLTALFGMSLSVVLGILSGPLVQVLLGGKWTGMVVPFQLLAMSMYPRLGYRVAAGTIIANGGIRFANYSQVAYAAMIVTGAWLAVGGGLAAVSAVVAAIVWVHFFVLNFIAFRRVGLTLRELIELYSPPAFTAVLVAAAVYPISGLLHAVLPPVVLLLAGALAGAAIFFAAGLLKPRLFWGEEGAWLASSLRSRIAAVRAK